MKKRSFFYKNPVVYEVGLKLIHGKNLSKRYNYISERIGGKKTVLEPACGPALLPNYLDSTCSYSGFDINEQFINHGKNKNLNVFLGDAIDFKSYARSDVVILCDALHHMGPENEKILLEHSLNSATRQLIICDPFKNSFLDELANWLPGIRYLFSTWFNYMEKDGNNQVKLENIRTRKELEELMIDGFGVIPKQTKKEIKHIGSDLIAIYYL